MLLDSARIDSDHTANEYTRAVWGVSVPLADRYRMENTWRQQKNHFREQHLAEINSAIDTYQFSGRYGGKAGFEANLDITEEGISIRSRGKGRQCFIKTESALRRREEQRELHALLLEEPENHLSHVNMKKLVNKLAEERRTQLFVATHSSHISSRLDLRNALLLGDKGPAMLRHLSDETAHFFMKAPDNNVLEFALTRKVILVEGDAEFILIEAFYRILNGRAPEDDGVHVIAIGGTSFRRYLELANLLGNSVAALRDNDGNYQQNCVVLYQEIFDHTRIFADNNDDRSTFEICLYQDNNALCEATFGASRRTLSVQEYTLASKAEAAFKLLQDHGDTLSVPGYIREAIEWINEFQDRSGRVYHGRLSQLLMYRELMPVIRARFERYFDELLVDEVQDFAGHDFNFLLELCAANASVVLTGDFYQHTFDMSRDGNTNATLHHDFHRYEGRFRSAGIAPDRETLSKTWRCSQTVCEFISRHLSIG